MRLRGSDADWYGEVQLVLKDSVKERSYFTVNDSLNTAAVPIPIYGDQVMPQTVSQLGGSYVEVQIPGPIPMSEIAEINVTDYGIDEAIDPYAVRAMVQNGLSLTVPIRVVPIRGEDGEETTVGEYLSDAGLAPATPDEVG
jgi:hypothetical protein